LNNYNGTNGNIINPNVEEPPANNISVWIRGNNINDSPYTENGCTPSYPIYSNDRGDLCFANEEDLRRYNGQNGIIVNPLPGGKTRKTRKNKKINQN